MIRVSDVGSAVNSVAPFRSAYEGDPVGLQIGDPSSEVTRAVVSLDRSTAAIARCVESGAQLLVCHHPLIYRPLPSITAETHDGKACLELIKNGIAYIAAHTNWDCAEGGVNDELARLVGLSDVTAFGDSGPAKETKLVVFAPIDVADRIIDAMSEAGAGVIGNYERCAFISQGAGTFIPQSNARPAIGARGQRETVDEARIEMVVPNERLSRVVHSLTQSHPYEEPAYDLIPLVDRKQWPIARIGSLPRPMRLADFVLLADTALQTRSYSWGDPNREIRQVAVCGGSGADLWRSAQRAGADALITGECPQHVALEAADSGLAIVSSGHYATENPGARALKERLEGMLDGIAWEFFEPEPGFAGRPYFV